MNNEPSIIFTVNPTCTDNLLLHFPYEEHYNDVTCHQAIATKYGEGVSIRHDSDRAGNVACFTGQTHFEVCVQCTVQVYVIWPDSNISQVRYLSTAT